MSEALNALLADIEDRLDPASETVTAVWPRNASACHLGPAGVLLSAAVTLTCDGCGQTVRMVGQRVEGYFGESGALFTESTWSRQHGCGTWAPTLVEVAYPLDDHPGSDVMVTELRLAVLRERTIRDDDTDVRLRRDLAEFLTIPEEDREPTGSEIEPGIYFNGQRWVAWAYAAGSPDTVTVTEPAGWDFHPEQGLTLDESAETPRQFEMRPMRGDRVDNEWPGKR